MKHLERHHYLSRYSMLCIIRILDTAIHLNAYVADLLIWCDRVIVQQDGVAGKNKSYKTRRFLSVRITSSHLHFLQWSSPLLPLSLPPSLQQPTLFPLLSQPQAIMTEHFLQEQAVNRSPMILAVCIRTTVVGTIVVWFCVNIWLSSLYLTSFIM